MGCCIKAIDAILFLFFLLIAIVAPLFDAQSCIHQQYYPKQLVDLKSWYGNEYGDYLVLEKPHFFVGLIWMELFFTWPLSIINLYAIVSGKSWFNTSCLIYGAAVATSMVAILSELIGSGRATQKLLMIYYPFFGLSILALVRGLLPASCTTTSVGKKPLAPRKKRV